MTSKLQHPGVHTAALIAAAMAYFVFLADAQLLWDRAIFYVFQTRDLLRAELLAQGQPIFFGPEMTGGGNLSGPLYYALLAVSQLVAKGWTSAWVQMMGLAALAAALVTRLLHRHGWSAGAIVFLTLFAVSVQTRHFLTLFINPSYLFLFAALALMDVVIAFSTTEARHRSRAALRAGLWIGLGIQIHFSIVFLLFAMMFMQAFSDRLRVPHVPGVSFTWALVVFALPSLPYYTWLILGNLGFTFAQQPAYAGKAEDVLPTLAHLVEAVAALPMDNLWHVIKTQMLRVTPFALPLLLIAQLWDQGKTRDERWSAFARPLTIACAFAFLPFSYVFFVPIANRYGMPFFMGLLILTALVHVRLNRSRAGLNAYLILGGLTLTALLLFFPKGDDLPNAMTSFECAVALLAMAWAGYRFAEPSLRWAAAASFAITTGLGFIQYEYFRNGDLHVTRNNMVAHRLWKAAFTRIHRRTGWSLAEAQSRIFFINAHLDGDPKPGYEAVLNASFDAPVTIRDENLPSGYLFFLNPPLTGDLEAWIMTQPVAIELREALAKDYVELGPLEPIGRGKVAIAPFWIRAPEHLPKTIHNWALEYDPFPEADLLAQAPGAAKAVALSDTRVLFKWNECPDLHPYCDAGVLVTVSREHEQTVLDVRVTGAPLAQVSPWIHPLWTQAWDEPYVEAQCGARALRFKLATAIGYKRENLYYDAITGYFLANNGWIAPLERRFQFPCPEGVRGLAAGRSGSTVDRLRFVEQLPAQRLVLPINTRLSKAD